MGAAALATTALGGCDAVPYPSSDHLDLILDLAKSKDPNDKLNALDHLLREFRSIGSRARPGGLNAGWDKQVAFAELAQVIQYFDLDLLKPLLRDDFSKTGHSSIFDELTDNTVRASAIIEQVKQYETLKSDSNGIDILVDCVKTFASIIDPQKLQMDIESKTTNREQARLEQRRDLLTALSRA